MIFYIGCVVVILAKAGIQGVQKRCEMSVNLSLHRFAGISFGYGVLV